MSGARQQRPEDDGREAMDRLMAERPEPTPAVADALRELRSARVGASQALDELTSATKAALDVPAKIRRNPVRTAALVGGAGFLLAGGPRRVVRIMGRAVRPPRRKPDPHEGLLPDEIERVLKDSGLAKDPEVRRALDEDFADYLRSKGRYRGQQPSAATSFWRTFDKVAGPLGTAGARVMVQRLMEADRDRSDARREVRRRRTASTGGLARPGPASDDAQGPG